MSSPYGNQPHYSGGDSQPGPYNSPQDPQAAQQAFSQGQPYGASPAASQQAFSQGQPYGASPAASQQAFSQGQPYAASQPAFSQNPPAGAAPGAANASAPGAASGSAAGGAGGFGQPQAPKQPSAFGLREILLAVGAFLVFVSMFLPQYKWGTDSFYSDSYEWLWSFSLNGSGVLMLGVLPVLAAGLIGVLNKTVRSFPQHIGSFSPDQFVTALAVSGAAVQFVRFIHLFAFSTPSWGAFIGLLGAGLAAFVTVFTMIPALGASEFDARESVPAHPKARPVRRAPAQAPAVQPGFGQPGPVPGAPAQNGQVQGGPAQPGFAQQSQEWPGSGQHVQAQSGPAHPGFAQPAPAESAPAQQEPNQSDAARGSHAGTGHIGAYSQPSASSAQSQSADAAQALAPTGENSQAETAKPAAAAASETADPVAPAASETAEPAAPAADVAAASAAPADFTPVPEDPVAPSAEETSPSEAAGLSTTADSKGSDAEKHYGRESDLTASDDGARRRDTTELSGASADEGRQEQPQPEREEPVQEETQLFQAFPTSQSEQAQPQQTPFWFAVPEPRVAVDPAGNPAFQLEPGKWILAMADNGDSFTVQSEDGRIGELRNVHGVERG
ncbi:hypothetical protein [Brevibacterium sp. HMSC22B09]|uniref:hypothetical protein n=1 Tax=Brevibacterium sp. HMSC22B09 TaxID=1581055 RepID=UPI0008A32953|nr:hypothetical protein [Brevibacterium sp. HMSC22B09]OFT97346.1 hypothetical protein HMPREF3087_05355 [Brevibacterium sp. HMSC22B09]